MKTTADSSGKTLKTAREEALHVTTPTGMAVVVGRLYKHGSLSSTWLWVFRLQPVATAPCVEELEGGGRFVGVEVSARGANVYNAMLALSAHDASLLGGALVLRLAQDGRPDVATALQFMLKSCGL